MNVACDIGSLAVNLLDLADLGLPQGGCDLRFDQLVPLPYA
jgi:hypothetical protein